MARLRIQRETDEPPAEDVHGRIVLWADGTRRNVVVYVGEDGFQRFAENIDRSDKTALDGWLLQALDRAGVSLSDYRGNRSFHVDVQVPDAVIRKYYIDGGL